MYGKQEEMKRELIELRKEREENYLGMEVEITKYIGKNSLHKHLIRTLRKSRKTTKTRTMR